MYVNIVLPTVLYKLKAILYMSFDFAHLWVDFLKLETSGLLRESLTTTCECERDWFLPPKDRPALLKP